MIGILGGTFDPVHIAHIRVGRDVVEALDLDELRYVPCRIPPHRGAPVASPAQRARLLGAALAGEDRLVIDTRELEREGPSYMIDTLASVRAEIGDRPLVLVLGADAFHGLPEWHRWRELFALAHIVVMGRPGAANPPPPALAAEIAGRAVSDPELLRTRPAGLVAFVPVTPFDVSSTEIRRCMATGGEWRSLVPAPVAALIGSGDYYPMKKAS